MKREEKSASNSNQIYDEHSSKFYHSFSRLCGVLEFVTQAAVFACSPEKFLFMTSRDAYKTHTDTNDAFVALFFSSSPPHSFYFRLTLCEMVEFVRQQQQRKYFFFVLYFLIYGRMRELTCAVSSLTHSLIRLFFRCHLFYFVFIFIFILV